MEELMLYTKNYFYRWKEYGSYTINNNQITCRGQYKVGQYVRIIGSVFNDGVHEIHSVTNNIITINSLRNEEFKGYICGLAVPTDFYELVQDIKAYRLKHKASLGMQSESFAGYSYVKDIRETQEVFSDRIKPYRKLYDDFRRVKEV